MIDPADLAKRPFPCFLDSWGDLAPLVHDEVSKGSHHNRCDLIAQSLGVSKCALLSSLEACGFQEPLPRSMDTRRQCPPSRLATPTPIPRHHLSEIRSNALPEEPVRRRVQPGKRCLRPSRSLPSVLKIEDRVASTPSPWTELKHSLTPPYASSKPTIARGHPARARPARADAIRRAARAECAASAQEVAPSNTRSMSMQELRTPPHKPLISLSSSVHPGLTAASWYPIPIPCHASRQTHGQNSMHAAPLEQISRISPPVC